MFSVKTLCVATGCAAAALFVVSCGGSGGSRSSREVIEVVRKPGFNPNHGPFDSRGNYVDRWADNPPRRVFVDNKGDSKKTKSQTASRPSPPPPVVTRDVTPRVVSPPRTTYTPPVVERRQPSPRPQPRVQPKPQPKPRAAVIKPKAKAPVRHVVKKGDTLYSLSRRYGTTVTAIQRANGLKGTNIRTGSTLLIPRK